MKRWRWVIFTPVVLVIIVTFVLIAAHLKSSDAVRVYFLGMTNDPSQGPTAILCVTNRGVSLINCGTEAPQIRTSSGWTAAHDQGPSGLAYLELGESYVFTVPVPKGSGPWRVPVFWQRQDLNRFEEFVNRQHDSLLVLSGQPNGHRDAWVPFSHTVYSPELPR